MTTQEVIVAMTPKSKRRDIALRHCVGRSVGSEPEVAQVPKDRVPTSGRTAVASRINPEAGTSRDGWRCSMRFDLEISNLQVGRRIMGL
jgi:hypothetical protein